MNVSNKYDPYQGYGYGKPWYWYRTAVYGAPRRKKTKSDWVWHFPKRQEYWEGLIHYSSVYSNRRIYHTDEYCKHCGKSHCLYCGCARWWKKWISTGGSTYEKKDAHRRFRRQAKYAIWRELKGDDDVSHNFYVSGDWLD
ncbi:MAG: hypothetical protein ACXWQ5_00450 [Ktedonobacterales bacterium]